MSGQGFLSFREPLNEAVFIGVFHQPAIYPRILETAAFLIGHIDGISGLIISEPGFESGSILTVQDSLIRIGYITSGSVDGHIEVDLSDGSTHVIESLQGS